MIHFKVIRASRLLLTLAVLILAAVLALLGTRLLAQRNASPVNGSASLVEANVSDEAKTETVFASSDHSDNYPKPTPGKIEIEIIRSDEESARVRRILIYHTHTHEAYEQVESDPYKSLDAWRTVDAGHSVVRVGKELANCLRQYGFDVVHDTTDHEENELSTAYSRSLETLMKYKESFDLYLDLHRDAYVEGEPIAVSTPDGGEMAPLMILIGNGNGFDTKPWYAQNLCFARALETRINKETPGLCKPVLVKDGRYNQHIGIFSILVEVGHNHNTLAQACNSVSPLARAIFSLLTETPDPQIERIKAAWDAGHRNDGTVADRNRETDPLMLY